MNQSKTNENKVQLYLYDLTKLNKWNKILSLFAKAVNSGKVIPHTTIVVFDTEYYYGESGIGTLLSPGEIDNPVEIVELGTTSKSVDELEAWLKEKILSGEYTAKRYKILENNCICFSNAMSEFLCGKSIDPKYFDTQRWFNKFVPSEETMRVLGVESPKKSHNDGENANRKQNCESSNDVAQGNSQKPMFDQYAKHNEF